jgi:hypothetical protein
VTSVSILNANAPAEPARYVDDEDEARRLAGHLSNEEPRSVDCVAAKSEAFYACLVRFH